MAVGFEVHSYCRRKKTLCSCKCFRMQKSYSLLLLLSSCVLLYYLIFCVLQVSLLCFSVSCDSSVSHVSVSQSPWSHFPFLNHLPLHLFSVKQPLSSQSPIRSSVSNTSLPLLHITTLLSPLTLQIILSALNHQSRSSSSSLLFLSFVSLLFCLFVFFLINEMYHQIICVIIIHYQASRVPLFEFVNIHKI